MKLGLQRSSFQLKGRRLVKDFVIHAYYREASVLQMYKYCTKNRKLMIEKSSLHKILWLLTYLYHLLVTSHQQ